MIRKTSMLAILACSGMALASGSASAADEVKVIKAEGALNSLKVVVDPQTGAIRAATPEEAEAMAQQPTARVRSKMTSGVINRPTTTILWRPDGSATVRRAIEDLDSLVAETGPDGKVTVRHAGAPASNLPKE